MKRLAEMFGVVPGYAVQLEAAGVRTILDLANSNDLESLCRTSGVPSDLLQNWHRQAVLEVASQRRRRRAVTILLTVAVGLFLVLAAWSYLQLGSGLNGSHLVSLDWRPSTSSDIVGYNVYRATRTGGPYGKLNGLPVADTSYIDTTAREGGTYFYAVTAIDRNGRESYFSQEIQATIPAS